MAVSPTDDLLERLKDPEYAKLYGAENAKVDFAITLTKARKSLNLTQKSLADKLGISQPYVAKLESGEANPTLGKVGSLLATIDLRLVTGTAPLKPELIPLTIGVILMGAGDAVDATSYLSTSPLQNAGTECLAPIEQTQYRGREIAVGGAAR